MTQAGFKPTSMRTVNHLIIDFAIAYKSDYNKHHNGRICYKVSIQINALIAIIK